MKMVFTLKSGKSIVESVLETEAFTIMDTWLAFIPEGNADMSKVIIDKKNKEVTFEKVGILVSDISAIQIVDINAEYKK